MTSGSIITILAGLYLVYSLWDDLKKKPVNWIKVCIGAGLAVLITGFTIYKNATDDNNDETASKKTDTQTIKLDSILHRLYEDSIYFSRLDSIGIHRDSTKNQAIISNTFINQIINQYNVSPTNESFSENKLREAFNSLGQTDFLKKEIALDYILANFPKTLTDAQIVSLLKANTVVGGLSEKQNKLFYLITNQKKSPTIIDYCKSVIQIDESNSLAWHYLLRKDVNVDLEYILTTIKSKPNYALKYANIVQYAMDEDNFDKCNGLLNSVDLVNLILTNVAESEYVKQAYDWLTKMTDRKISYSKYKQTYFFKAAAKKIVK